MNTKTASFKVLALALLAGFACSGGAFGQDVSSDELISFARAAAQGQATERQKAVLFANNERLNNLAIAGKLSDAEYQHNQRAFVEKNDELIRSASSRHGLDVAPPKGADTYKAGTDTDRQLRNPRGELTVDHVKNVRQEYNRQVSAYLAGQGVGAPAGENWSKKLTTDIMPSPYDMKPGDFKNATSYINSDGGLAYTDADAAKLQLSLDGGRPVSPTVHEAAAFHAEMQKKTAVMNTEIRRLNAERAKLTDPAAIENVDVEIRKHTAFMSKYLGRDAKAAELVGGNSDRIGLSEESYSRGSAEKVKQAQGRDASRATKNAEAHVGAVSEHLARNATRRFNDAIAGAAVAGGDTTAAKAIIAENIKNLPPTQKAQAIADLEVKYGGDLAKGVNAELKKSAAPRPAAGRGATVANRLGLIGTVLNIGTQYSQGKTTTQILWNMSLGGTLESVNRETVDYTQKEVERLKVKYLAAGEDINSTAVKLKIMAEASIKGTFHGTVIGSYDLLKSATHTAAGAAAAVADSAIFLVGETLDTRNVLETTYAEMQAQNMEQSVQNARAVKFAKEGLVELKRLANDAAYLRGVLEQNARSAREFCRSADRVIDRLREEQREIEGLEGADALKTLPEKEKRVASSLAVSTLALQTMVRQAEAAKRALDAGGAPQEALQTARALNDGFAKHAEAVETCKNEMFGIGELASFNSISDIMKDFEAGKTALLDLGRQAAANAEIMRKNEARYKSTLAAFDTLKERIGKAEGFFAGKRESNEADWVVITSRLAGIARPEGTMPDDFFGEVGTLERLPEKIRGETGRLRPAAAPQAGSADIAALANASLERLTPPYNTAARTLAELRAALDALRAAAAVAPGKPSQGPTWSEIQAAKGQKKPAQPPKPAEQPRVKQPAKSNGRLPCGHMPGECPTSGIASIKCRLHSGQISNR